MDETHLGAALRYVAFNPVRARLAAEPRGWRWSSVHACLDGADDGVTACAPVLERYPDFAAWIVAGEDEALSLRLKRAETVGRPIGSEAFIAGLERQTGRDLLPAKRGRRPKANKVHCHRNPYGDAATATAHYQRDPRDCWGANFQCYRLTSISNSPD